MNDKKLTIRLTDAEKTKLDRVSAAENCGISEVIRKLINNYPLVDEPIIKLRSEKYAEPLVLNTEHALSSYGIGVVQYADGSIMDGYRFGLLRKAGYWIEVSDAGLKTRLERALCVIDDDNAVRVIKPDVSLADQIASLKDVPAGITMVDLNQLTKDDNESKICGS